MRSNCFLCEKSSDYTKSGRFIGYGKRCILSNEILSFKDICDLQSCASYSEVDGRN